MNTKFISVLQKILSKPDGIDELFREDNEYYFRYMGHCFSINKSSGESEAYIIYVYTKWDGPLRRLAESFAGFEPPDTPVAAYHESQFAEPTDKNKFVALYSLLQNRELNIDSVFDDILNT